MKGLARFLRRCADRLDPHGAPRRSSWSYTLDPKFGAVFNQDSRGCPLWFYGEPLSLDTSQVPLPDEDCAIQWVTIGSRTPDGVHVLGSAEVTRAVTTRHAVGYDEVKVPNASRVAKIPRWRITLRCEMDSFVTLPGSTYPEAVTAMFQRPGIRG